MSIKYKLIRQTIAVCVALLQLAVVPATYELHVGCQHGPPLIPAGVDLPAPAADPALQRNVHWLSTLVAGLFRPRCSCDEHHCSDAAFGQQLAGDSRVPTDCDGPGGRPNSPGHHPPHDSSSCPVCQAAFAVVVFCQPPLLAALTVDIKRLSDPSAEVPRWSERYRLLSRGPPRGRRFI